MKNIIIFTGASSPICQSLLKSKSLLERYDKVFTYSRNDLNLSGNITKQFIHDYTNNYEVPQVLSGSNVDIFHAAAAVPAYYSNESWISYKRINVDQPVKFVQRTDNIAKSINLFFLSSTSVYDKTDGSQLLESSKKTNIDNFYGYSKLLFERSMEESKHRYFGLRVPVLLCPNVKHNFLSKLKSNLINKKQIRISHPQAPFNAIVSDRDILKLANSFFTKNINRGIYNAGSSDPVTLHHLLNKIDRKYEEVESALPPQLISIDKLKTEGFVPETTEEVFLNYFLN